jgi:hypothetical protein
MNQNPIRASAALRLSRCPGSAAACLGLADTTSPDAEFGLAVHRVLAQVWNQDSTGGVGCLFDPVDWSALSTDAKVCETADKLWSKFLIKVGTREDGSFDQGTKVCRVYTEIALERSPWTGTADLLVLVEYSDGTRRAHLVDWKSGFGDVDPADENAQIRVYVSMIPADFFGDDRFVPVVAHIITPIQSTSALFLPLALAEARDEVFAIAERALAPDAPRSPSPSACKYCKAFGRADRCPESEALPGVLAAQVPAIVASGVATLPGDRLSYLLSTAALVDKLAKQAKAEARTRLELDPSSVPGWGLKPGRTIRTVADPRAAVERLVLAGIPERKILDACSLSLPDLGIAVSDVRSITRKAGDALVAEILGDAIETKSAAASLVEV